MSHHGLLVLLTSTVFLLTACGGDASQSTAPPPDTSAIPSVTNSNTVDLTGTNSGGSTSSLSTSWQGTWARQYSDPEGSDTETLQQQFYNPSLHYVNHFGQVIGSDYSYCTEWPLGVISDLRLSWSDDIHDPVQWDRRQEPNAQEAFETLGDNKYTLSPSSFLYDYIYERMGQNHYSADFNYSETSSTTVAKKVSDQFLVNSIWLTRETGKQPRQFPGCTSFSWFERDGVFELSSMVAKIPMRSHDGEMLYRTIAIELPNQTTFEVGSTLDYENHAISSYVATIDAPVIGRVSSRYYLDQITMHRKSSTEIELTATWENDEQLPETAKAIIYLHPDQWLPSPYQLDSTTPTGTISHNDSDGDGYEDRWDAFPLNPDEWLDTDRDGIGDNRENGSTPSQPASLVPFTWGTAKDNLPAVDSGWQGTWAHKTFDAEKPEATLLEQNFYSPALHYLDEHGQVIGADYTRCIEWPINPVRPNHDTLINAPSNWRRYLYWPTTRKNIDTLQDSIYTVSIFQSVLGQFKSEAPYHYRHELGPTTTEGKTSKKVSDRDLVNSIWLTGATGQQRRQFPGCTAMEWRPNNITQLRLTIQIPLKSADGKMLYRQLNINLQEADLKVGSIDPESFTFNTRTIDDTRYPIESSSDDIDLQVVRITPQELEIQVLWQVNDHVTNSARGVVYLNPNQWLPSPYQRDSTSEAGTISNNDRDGDGYEDRWDSYPDNPREWVDTDADGIADNQDSDDDNDSIPDNADQYPAAVDYGNDTDGDGNENHEDLDDDGDGVDDDADPFPLDPTEQRDTDADGIGDNTDTDDDGDGLPDLYDNAPLDDRCGTADDSISGICSLDVLSGADLFAHAGDYAFIANSSINAIVPFRLDTQSAISPFIAKYFAAESDAADYPHLTAMNYVDGHQRLYLGWSSGVITYIDLTTFESHYFQTLTGSIGGLSAAGNFLYVQADIDNVKHYTIAKDSTVMQEDSFGRRVFWSDALWQENDQRLYYTWNNSYSGYYSYKTIDPNTGHIPDADENSQLPKIRAPLRLALSPNGNTLLTSNGHLYNTDTTQWIKRVFADDIVDLHWSDDNSLVTIEPKDGKLLLRRYTPKLIEAERKLFIGEPYHLFRKDDRYYIVARHGDQILIHVYAPSDDTDADGVVNTQDDFPNNEAVSVDTDQDGYPDRWNPGYDADVNNGLTIDAYPLDPACHQFSDGNGTRCNYNRFNHAPNAVVTNNNGTVYILNRNENLVYRWHLPTAQYIEPLKTGIHSENGTQSPSHMIYSAETNHLYFAYASGQITSISLDAEAPEERKFAALHLEPLGLASAGDILLAIDSRNGFIQSRNLNYYNANGQRVDLDTRDPLSNHFAWNNSSNRLYYLSYNHASTILSYSELSSVGSILSSGDMPDRGDNTFEGPILVSPAGDKVLLGAGDYYDAESLELLGSISRKFDYGTFLPTGELVTLTALDNNSELSIYDDYVAAPTTKTITGTPLGVLSFNGALHVVTYTDEDGVHVMTVQTEELLSAIP